jgi:hypothetical protein
MKKMRFAAIALLSAGLLSGCLAPPTFLNPGSENYQVQRAQRFDPYPVTDSDSGSMMAGTRPPGFESPQPEVLRGQTRIPDAPGY